MDMLAQLVAPTEITATYVFNKSTLVLEGITLAELVQLVVEVLINLASSTVLDEKASEDS